MGITWAGHAYGLWDGVRAILTSFPFWRVHKPYWFDTRIVRRRSTPCTRTTTYLATYPISLQFLPGVFVLLSYVEDKT